LNNYASRSTSPFLGGAAGTLASLYEASANMMDPSWSDYLDRTLRRYDNAGRIYDRELGPCGKGKLWAAYAAGAYFLGDYFGLNGLWEGIYGVDLVTEESLSTADRWSRGLSGLASHILFSAPALSRISAFNRPLGSTAAPLGPAAAKGTIVLDADPIISAIGQGRAAAVDAAIAGRTPLVPITAAKQVIGRHGADTLREFLAARGGRIALAGSEATAAQLRGLGPTFKPARVLGVADSRIAASAVREGAPVLTNDRKFFRFLRAIGQPAEGY
jgi:predicted nucleic acid-binding protein